MRYLIRSGFGLVGSVIWTIVAFTCTSSPVAAQNDRGSGPGTMVPVSSVSPRASQNIVREIDDPTTGDRWLLVRDKQQPGGPGRMILLAREKASPTTVRASAKRSDSKSVSSAIAALIHTNDHLIVEEHTKLMDVSLEAIALAPAYAGQIFRVRLSIGGRVVKVIAAAAGRATLIPEAELQP